MMDRRSFLAAGFAGGITLTTLARTAHAVEENPLDAKHFKLLDRRWGR